MRFDSYVFELQTTIEMYLARKRIADYMTLVFKDQGRDTANTALDYIVIVRAQVMLMTVSYHTFKNEGEDVCDALNAFNTDFESYVHDFKAITGYDYKPGKELQVKLPVAKSLLPETDSNAPTSAELLNFLELHGLQNLQRLLENQGVEVDDLLTMTNQEMMDLGIKAYKDRRKLLSLRPNTGEWMCP